MKTVAITALVLVTLVGLPGCTGPSRATTARSTAANPLYGPSSRGNLLIVGGGLKDDHAAVYTRFIELAGPNATIGVVPTATGEESRGQDTFNVIQRYLRPDQRLTIIPLYKEDTVPTGQTTGKADDPAIALQIRSCRALWFVGGDQSRITAVFRPQSPSPSAAYLATLAILRSGGCIAGTSAGAAMMTNPMITGGSSESALKNGAYDKIQNPDGSGVGLAPGMGYWTHAASPDGPIRVQVDQHFTQRDRFGRLWIAMGAMAKDPDCPEPTIGYGIPENCALEVDLATGERSYWGTELIVEMRRDTGSTHGYCNAPSIK